MVYFDNGSSTFPKPSSVIDAVTEAFTIYGGNPGRSANAMCRKTAAKIQSVRENIASFFGVENPLDVIFTSNCTHAANIALKGLLREGDHVIISDLDHNAVLRPVHTLAKRGLIQYNVAEIFTDTERTVASFRRLIRAETRLIACSHASNVFGIRAPINEIGALCKAYGILFLVDAAQTAGVLDIDIPEAGIDYFCAAGHKGLYGPSGTGLLITSQSDILNTMIEGGTGTHSENYEQPREMPDYLESGTLNTVGIVGLDAGISFLREEGNIYQREMTVATEIYRTLCDIERVRLYTANYAQGSHVPVISFNIEGLSGQESTMKLSQMGFALRGGLHCAPLAHKKMGTLDLGTARVSVGAFNTFQQAEQLCNAIKKIAH